MTESPIDNQLIYDVGAHKGEDTEFYLKKGFRVVAIEAHTELARGIRERFRREIDEGRLALVEGAIAEAAGEEDFYVNEVDTSWGTTRAEWAARNEMLRAPSRRIRVQGIRFGDILRKHGMPRYLKVDIEGADLLCLEALADFREKPKFVSIESEKKSWQKLLHEFELLERQGYTKFQVVDQRKIGRQRVPKPAREGAYAEQEFKLGSSGLFGEELPGRWMSGEEAVEQYRGIFRRYELYGDCGRLRRNIVVRSLRGIPLLGEMFKASWYDTHAARE